MLNSRILADPNTIINWWNAQNESQTPYIYQSLFPSTYISNDKVTTRIVENNYLDLMTSSTEDVIGKKLKNQSTTKQFYELIPFKNYKTFTEKKMKEINNEIAMTNSQDEINAIVNAEYSNLMELLSSAYMTREYLAMQTLTTGKVDIHSNDLNYVRDFNVPAEHQNIQVKTEWGTKDSTPITDIQENIEKMTSDTGATIKLAIMNKKTFQKMAKSGEVKTAMYGVVTLGQTAMTENIGLAADIQIITYNKMIGSKNILPDDVVILAPSGSLGRMAWSPTNAELSLDHTDMPLAKTIDGVSVYTDSMPIDPFNTRIFVAQEILPVLDQANNIMTLKVGQASSN